MMEQMLRSTREDRAAVPRISEHDAGPAERSADQPLPRFRAQRPRAKAIERRQKRREEERQAAVRRPSRAAASVDHVQRHTQGLHDQQHDVPRKASRSTQFTIEKIKPSSVIVKSGRVSV